MGKSIYSLVLLDEVVDAVDELARGAGMSRSAMINHILAEKVAFTTPEMRLTGILESLASQLNSAFLVSDRPTGGTLCARTSLKYPYKPTLKYSVEIFSRDGIRGGELKVTSRTRSERLNADLERFYGIWTNLEREYISDKIHTDIIYRIKDGQFARTLNCPDEQISDEELGAAVAEYMEMFDGAMKEYFLNLPDIEKAESAAEEYYHAELAKQRVIV